ncbi:hypothetical protein [Arthrobacter sp. UYCu712]|uniref:hypothetical protein n=1 Tax=Arthrobacter sp. UYCu712 TaxID=3156340 RepID=UPI00339A30C2
MALGELEDDPVGKSNPELAKKMAELRAEVEVREPRKDGLRAKAAAAISAGLATSAGLPVLPGLQKLIQRRLTQQRVTPASAEAHPLVFGSAEEVLPELLLLTYARHGVSRGHHPGTLRR